MTLAGGYFQLVVWGIATVVWRIVAEETVISQVALIVILFAGLQTLFNFNPLIKLDGYYMLSDYLEIPNLRAKAMKAVHAWLGSRSEPLLVSDQRRSLLVYGGLSLTFSTLLLLFVYVNIYLLATFYFDFTGLVGFVMFSTFTLKRTAAESVPAARSLGARALIRKYRNLGIGAVFLIAIIVIPWGLRISADFRILPRQESIVRAETAGTVDEILVTEGDDVAAGDLIARLYDPDKEKELSFVEGELASKRAELAQLRAGPRPEEIDQAETLVETRRTELANVSRNGELRLQLEQTLAREENELLRAEIDLRKATDMFVEEVGPRIDMELAQAAVDAQKNSVGMTEASLRILTEETSRDSDLKQHELAEAESALALLLAGSRAEEIQAREADVVMLETQQTILTGELAKSEIRAPISGTIVTPFIERLLHEHLTPGAELCRIVDMDRVNAELVVPEKEMADVSMGSPVHLKVRSYPTEEFIGRVDFIAPVAETATDIADRSTQSASTLYVDSQRYIVVRTELGNGAGKLKAEMTGVAKIHAGKRLVIQLMTRRVVRWIRTEFWDILP